MLSSILKPQRRPALQLRRTLHRILDPILSQPQRWRAAQALRSLADGVYQVAVEVPYVPQFASPSLILHYIHDGLHGRDDPQWQAFGTNDVDQYTFWAHRACPIACLKMAIDAYQSAPSRSLWALIQDGIALGGYRTHDQHNQFIDQGWFHAPLVTLAQQEGLQVQSMAYASVLDVCKLIHQGWVVAAAVTPEIGERGALHRYDGHFVLVYGFVWQQRRCIQLLLHNPSGRYPELQANAAIPARRFGRAFAHRFMAFRANIPTK